jgi:hypothetical protein
MGSRAYSRDISIRKAGSALARSVLPAPGGPAISMLFKFNPILFIYTMSIHKEEKINKKQITIVGVLLMVIGITALVLFIRLIYMEDKIGTADYSVQEFSKRLTLIYDDLAKTIKGKIDNFTMQTPIINEINNQMIIFRYQFNNTIRLILCKIKDCEKDPFSIMSLRLNDLR